MQKVFSIVIFLFSGANIFSQKISEAVSSAEYKQHCQSHFEKIQLEGDANAETAKQFLKNYLTNLRDERVDLILNYKNESPGGYHFSFNQTFAGNEIYRSEIKVNVDRKNVVRSVFDNSFHTSKWNEDFGLEVWLDPDIPNQVSAYVKQNFSERAEITSEKNVLFIKDETQQPLPAHEIKLNDDSKNISREIVIGTNGFLFSRDLHAYLLPDSTVSGKAFHPDPLTSAQQTYGGIYADNNDANALWLDNEEQIVNFTATFTGSQFKLQNNFVYILDFDSPQISPATSVTPQFYYNRSQYGFEDVNTFYHITAYGSHVAALGFNLSSGFVAADPHAVSGADNSYFAPNYIPPRLYFGQGGVDDAEDADVVTHEYGHFLSNAAAAGSNVGDERNALDEAFGDYVAASYSKTYSTFKCDSIFNWDGMNPFWNGRAVNNTYAYPADFMANKKYHNGGIWSAVLWELHNEIGRNATDSLIYQTHYSYAQNISMCHAAELLIGADSTLNNGAYHNSILNHLIAHGLGCGMVSVNETENFSPHFFQDGKSFGIVNPALQKISFQILNIEGKIVSPLSDINQYSFHYNDVNLPSGVYLVSIHCRGLQKTFKWCKVN